MLTLKEKIENYKEKISKDKMIEPTIRVCVGVALTDVLNIVDAHEWPTLQLIYENEDNIFYRKLYGRLSMVLVGVVVILLLI